MTDQQSSVPVVYSQCTEYIEIQFEPVFTNMVTCYRVIIRKLHFIDESYCQHYFLLVPIDKKTKNQFVVSVWERHTIFTLSILHGVR